MKEIGKVAETHVADASMDMEKRLASILADVRHLGNIQAIHISEIAVLKNDQRNTCQRLEEIRDLIRDSNAKFESLSTRLAETLRDIVQSVNNSRG